MIDKILSNSSADYLKETIKVLYASNVLLQEQNKRLLGKTFSHDQAKFELGDKLATLKKRFIFKGSEKLSKYRPNKDNHKLLHNTCELENIEVTTTPLEQDEVIHSMDSCECPKCGNQEISEMKNQYEESTEIDVIERTYIEKKHKRQKYRCKSCESIITANGQPKLNPGARYSIDTAVNIAVDKFSYHLPLERIRRRMEEQGLNVDVKTLYSLTEQLYENLYPIMGMIKKEVLDYGYVHIDETGGKILKTKSNGYIWALTNVKGAYFQYELTRSGRVASEMLNNYEGTIINDGFTGYNRFKDRMKSKIKVANCWAHVRRKFFDCLDNYPQAEEVLVLIQQLYKVEHRAKTFKELHKLRQSDSKEIIDKIDKWMRFHGKVSLPRGALLKAITYTEKIWNGLTLFSDDPKIPLDNNAVERSLRNPVKGRDNYNGYMTVNGADTAMFFYTIIETCKKLKLNPRVYLAEMARRYWRKEELLTPVQYQS